MHKAQDGSGRIFNQSKNPCYHPNSLGVTQRLTHSCPDNGGKTVGSLGSEARGVGSISPKRSLAPGGFSLKNRKGYLLIPVIAF